LKTLPDFVTLCHPVYENDGVVKRSEANVLDVILSEAKDLA
jgi:hypothetical protein